MSPLYHDGEYGIPAELSPKGEPQKLNEEGGGKPASEAEADQALAALGAGIKKATRYSSLAADAQKVDVPKEGEKNLHNRPKGGGTTDD